MSFRQNWRRTFRASLIGSASAALVLAMPITGVSVAQAAEEAAKLEEIVVTGSRIRRTDVTANTPVLVLSTEQMAAQGTQNLADLLSKQPQFAASFGTARTQSTFSGAASSGLNLANLRNLGGIRTVVLINGRRVPAGTATSTSVDFNTLPSANIQSVEVLTGGASAIYGADAVSGVINIITKQDFEGIEVGAGYGMAFKKKDNINPNGYVMMGSSLGDRAHFTLTAQYDYQGLVSCADRELCAEDFAWFPPAAPTRGPLAYSAVAPQGRFFIDAGRGLAATSVTSRGGSFTDAAGNLIPFVTSIDGYNRNPRRTLAIPTERSMVAFDANYKILDNVKAFVEFNYGRSETTAPFEGHPFQSNTDLVGGVVEPTIPVDNPFIPAAIRNRMIAAGDAALTWSQRFDSLGLRGATNKRSTWRVVGGLSGTFDTLGGIGKNWAWEASYVRGRTELNSITDGLVGRDRLFNGLRVELVPGTTNQYRCVDPVARAQGCVPVNPFAPFSQDMVNYLTVRAGQDGTHTLEDAQAWLSGSLFDLPAGPVQVATGVEWREISGFLDYADAINRGLTTGNQIGDVSKAIVSTKEGYIETVVPVVKDVPFIQALNLEGAVRYSETNGKNYTTWKAGGDWAPLNSIRFRVMRSKSVRAPVPGDLSGVGETAGVVNDPCTAARRNANPARAAACLAAGVPANYTPPLAVEQSVRGFVGGNPNVKNEESKSWVYGAVITPDFLPGFSATVDRFQILLEGAISTVGRQLKANLCYDNGQFCNDLTRGTDPQVPGATWVLKTVNDQLLNVGGYDIRGVDLAMRYQFKLADVLNSASDLGDLQLTANMTFYDKALYTPLPGQAPIDLLGYAGGSTSDQGYIKRTGIFGVDYAYENWTFGWSTKYIGKAGMSPFAPTFPTVPAYWYHNANLGWSPTDYMTLRVGILNIFDKKPPFFATGTAGTQALDTIPAYYDVFGRSGYVSVKFKF